MVEDDVDDDVAFSNGVAFVSLFFSFSFSLSLVANNLFAVFKSHKDLMTLPKTDNP